MKVTFQIFLNFEVLFKKKTNYPKLFYAGAKKGDIGGPFVKIKKLNKFFPENKWQFNIVYILSNSPNLSSYSINLLKNKKLPIILNQNGVFYPSWYKGNWKKQNLIISNIYHSADYVFWQSKFCKTASNKFLGKRQQNGEVLYNAVDTKKFKPNIDQNSKIFKFLITGNIRKQNNYRICSVLNAIEKVTKKNKNIHLYIAGNIEDEKYFSSKVELLKISNYVTLLGKYSQKNADLIYQKANAYITMSYQDNCPSAVIEAMSSGLPVLYSASGGVPELVGNKAGKGLAVPSSWEKMYIPSKEEICEGILEIIDNRKIMSEHARERALELFDIKKWIKRHSEIFKIFLK